MEKIVEERLKARENAIQEAKTFAICIAKKLGKITAILFGSYARGDFNEWSDIDVLILAENLPQNPIKRLDLIQNCLEKTPRIEPLIITISEFTKMKNKNPAIIDALKNGVILINNLETSIQ